MCDRKDLEALSPLRHFGNGNRKRNGKETGLAPSHTILHVKFTVYDYTHRYIYILNVRKTHCERNSFKNRQNILTLF